MTNEQLAALQAEINEVQKDPEAGKEHQEQPAKTTRRPARRTASVPSQPTAKRGTPRTAVADKPATTTAKRGTPKVAAATKTTVAKAPRPKATAKVVADADPIDASDPQDKVKAPSRKAEAKRALARLVVQAIAAQLFDIDGLAGADEETGATADAMLVRDELGVGAEMQRIVVQWIHHLPTGEAGGKRWWPEGLPTPDRSDWR